MCFYVSVMKSLRSEAIEEAKLLGHKFIVGKLYAECCTNAVGKSHYESCPDMPTAIAAAVGMTADVDWSATEWYESGDENVENAEPARDRAMQELFKSGAIRLGDYRIEFEQIA
jgi:hypothetical protein